MPFRILECRAEGNVQSQRLLRTLGRLWQGREELDPGGEVADGFQIGRAVASAFARLLPVGNSRLGEARLGVMMRQQFRLRLGGLQKVRF